MYQRRFDELAEAERGWLLEQSTAERAGTRTPDVLARIADRGIVSTIVISVMLGGTALVLGVLALMRLLEAAEYLNPNALKIVIGGSGLAALIVTWRVRAIIAAKRAPFLPLWIVTSTSLINVGDRKVSVWPLRDMSRLKLKLSRGGATMSGEYMNGQMFSVDFGSPLIGNLGWMQAGQLATAMENARAMRSSQPPFGIAAQTRLGPSPLRPAVIYGAALLVPCFIGGIYAGVMGPSDSEIIAEIDNDEREREAMARADREYEERMAAQRPVAPTPAAKPVEVPVTEPAPATPPAAKPEKFQIGPTYVLGTTPGATIDKILRSRAKVLRKCGEDAQGTITMKFLIEPNGSVLKADATGPGDAQLHECLSRSIKTFKFPSAMDRRIVTLPVTYNAG